jgi:hypothetical protein
MIEHEQITTNASDEPATANLDTESDNMNYKFMLMTAKMTSTTLTTNPEQNLLSPQISILSTQSSPHSSVSTTVNKTKILYNQNGRSTPSNNTAESVVSYCPYFDPHYWRYVLFHFKVCMFEFKFYL